MDRLSKVGVTLFFHYQASVDWTTRLSGKAWRGIMPSCASVLVMLCASGAFAASPTPDAATTPDPNATPASPGSTEFTEQPVDTGAATAPSSSGAAAGPFGFLSTASHSSTLFGDMWGLRPALSKYGMTLTIQEQSEIIGNVSGGARQGFDYEGLTTATLQMDTQRAFDWEGGLFNVSALQMHGRNMSAENLMTLQTASGIEADRSTRLWELWYQQKLLDGTLDIKAGQQSIDQEFMVSQNAGYFVNTMFGWPMLPSADLPGGGPAYPLSALGVRARAHPTDFGDRPRRRVQRQSGLQQYR